MLFHYTLRSILGHPLLNGIKVLGLALGLTGILFIILFVRYELSYDTFHPKAERIFPVILIFILNLLPHHLEGISGAGPIPTCYYQRKPFQKT